jgi:hypothetical protein
MENNKTADKINYHKKYYQEHKEVWFKKSICECGGKYLKANQSRHNLTHKHQEFVKKNSEKEQKKQDNINLLKDVVKNKVDNLELLNKLVAEIFD